MTLRFKRSVPCVEGGYVPKPSRIVGSEQFHCYSKCGTWEGAFVYSGATTPLTEATDAHPDHPTPRRPVLLTGLTLFTAASVVTAYAPSAGVLIGARILRSISGCAGLVTGRAAVRDAATPDKAADQLALLTLVVPALAPAVDGYHRLHPLAGG